MEHRTTKRQMAVAFIAGMVITAALAQTPAAASILAPPSTHEFTKPVRADTPCPPDSGDAPDTHVPVRPHIYEMVHTIIEEVSSPC